MNSDYVILRKLAIADAPGNGATIVIYDTTSFSGPVILDRGRRFKMLIFNIFSSHASAALGYTVDESNDGGANWDNLASSAVAATTYTKVYTKVSAPDFRVRYANSAAVITTFRGTLLGDMNERGNG